MKPSAPTIRPAVAILLTISTALLLAGCKTNANLGIDVGIHDGKVQVRPTAGIDFIGKAL